MIKKTGLYTMTFGEWIKINREEQKVSLRELERRINKLCTFGFINQLETNKYISKDGSPMQPDETIVIALAHALNLDLNEALTRAGYTVTSKIPTEIVLEGFEGLDSDDIKRVVAYIRFTKNQKPLT